MGGVEQRIKCRESCPPGSRKQSGGAHLSCEHSSMDGAKRQEHRKVTQGRRHQQN